jgi:CubicO group peptidase (beta-lactamase class C family)
VLPLVRQPPEYRQLEALVEKAAGQPYQQFVRARQFAPLHLRHTFFASELDSAPRELLAPGARHQRFLNEPALIDPSEPAEANGSGGAASSPTGIYASASDISVWDIALAGGILIKDPAHRKLLYEPAGAGSPSSGPWYFPGHQGLMVVTGSGEGFSSLLSRFTHRDELVCVTLLANREGLDLTQLARRIAGAHNGTIGPHAKGAAMRVQQSPYSVRDTIGRLERALRSRGIGVTSVDAEHGTLTTTFGRVEAWADNGEVWVAAPDPVKAAGGTQRAAQLTLRRTIDDALLQAIAPVDIR